MGRENLFFGRRFAPSRNWHNRVKDILAAIAEIKEFTNEVIYGGLTLPLLSPITVATSDGAKASQEAPPERYLNDHLSPKLPDQSDKFQSSYQPM